ncbi:hypothetical protein ACGC1H_002326 [Rhizoctonia solani]
MLPYTYTINGDHDRQQSVPQLEHSRVFETHFPEEDIPLGLFMLNIKHGDGCRIHSYINEIKPVDDKFEAYKATVHLDTWRTPLLADAGCTWLDVSRWDREFQFGRQRGTGELKKDQGSAQVYTFSRPFAEVPKVVVWLNTFNSWGKYDLRILAQAINVTTTEFTLDVQTWDDSVLHDSKVSWIAVPQNWPNVAAGDYVFKNDEALPEYKQDITFDKPFKRAPRVLVALNKIHASKDHGLQIEAKAESITPEGMTLSVKSREDSKIFEAGVSYIAIEDAD